MDPKHSRKNLAGETGDFERTFHRSNLTFAMATIWGKFGNASNFLATLFQVLGQFSRQYCRFKCSSSL